MDAFRIVREGYDRIGAGYRDASRENPVRLHWVDWVLNTIPAHSLVIDLGCGAGEPATRLLAEQHHVVGVDASMVQLQMTRKAAPTAALIQVDMTQLVLRPESVDAVVSFYASGHLTEAANVSLLKSAATWLRPDGWLVTSLPTVASESLHDSWLGAPMFFGAIRHEVARRTIEQSGLAVDTWTVVPEIESDGRVVEFAWVVARRRSSASG